MLSLTCQLAVLSINKASAAGSQARGLVERKVSPLDRRARLVTATAKGLDLLAAVTPRMLKSQQRLLEPLTALERKEFMRMAKILVDANAELSNIPTKE